MNDKALTTREPVGFQSAEALTATLQPTPMELLKAALHGGITEQNIAVVERMAALAERFEQRNAEKEFNRAFSALQADLPVIVASSVIPNRGKYEKFEDVMQQIQPCLTRHGFTVAFSNDFRDGRIIETCCLKHNGGHSQSNSFAVRVSGKADSETQADCKAATTAKRNALLNALNVIIRQDCLNEEEDPRLDGGPVSQKQAEELAHRVEMLGDRIDRPAFMKFAGVTNNSFATIAASRYEELDRLLAKKEK